MKGYRALDQVLRGEAGLPGSDPAAPLPIWPLVWMNLMLAATYGVCMGVYGLFRPTDPEWRQMVASAAKVPALVFLTLIVTFPSLYVFNTLLGSRLRLGDLIRLVLAGVSVLAAVLAAFGPIVAFFSLSTTSYPFILLLNVAVFAVSGLFGMSFLYRTLTRIPVARRLPAPPPAPEGEAPAPEPVGPPRPVAVPVGGGNAVFYAWMIVFGLVGGQMGWVLRPFVGSPGMPFTWFRPREASFIEGVAKAIRALIGG